MMNFPREGELSCMSWKSKYYKYQPLSKFAKGICHRHIQDQALASNYQAQNFFFLCLVSVFIFWIVTVMFRALHMQNSNEENSLQYIDFWTHFIRFGQCLLPFLPGQTRQVLRDGQSQSQAQSSIASMVQHQIQQPLQRTKSLFSFWHKNKWRNVKIK